MAARSTKNAAASRPPRRRRPSAWSPSTLTPGPKKSPTSTEVLKQRDAKLAEAQQAQADLIRKQRELDDAKREMDLTIQKQVQAELGAVRDQAKQEAEAALTPAGPREGRTDRLDAAADRRPAAQGRARLAAAARRGPGARPRSFAAAEISARPDRTGAEGRIRRRPDSAGGRPGRSNLSARSCGRPSAPRTGPTAGSASCGKISGRPRPTWR